ncbi:MAG TPA: class I SAM-dependent methyltransferase [Acidimicrobiales bacterium]
MQSEDRRATGRLFDEVPELYDRVRPTYPDELFADLVSIAGIHQGSSVLEVGCGTGQATRALAALGFSVTAVEPGAGMAALARQRLSGFHNVQVETSTFEEWDNRGRRFDLLLAAASWHWVDPAIGWPRAYVVLRPGAWMALVGHIVVRRPSEPEVYAETVDLHDRYCPGNPDWVIHPLRTRCAQPTRAGDRSRTPAPCSARPSYSGTPSCSGSTGPVSLIFSPLDLDIPTARTRSS